MNARFAALAVVPFLFAGCATASVNPPTTAAAAPVVALASAPAKATQPAEAVLTAPHAQALHGYPVVVATAATPETFVTFDLLVRPDSLVVIDFTDAKGNSLGGVWPWFILKSQRGLYESHAATGDPWQVVSLTDRATGSAPYLARVSLDFMASTMYTHDGESRDWISFHSTVTVEGTLSQMEGPIAHEGAANRPAVWDGTPWGTVTICAGNTFPVTDVTLLAIE